MRLYYYFVKVSRSILWGLLFPFLLFFVMFPVVIPLLYGLEHTLEVGAPGISTDIEVTKFVKSTDLLVTYSFPSYSGGFELGTKERDYRAIVLDEYFRQYNSPLYGLGDEFIAACKKYNAPFDCSTLPGIAFFETRLCTLDLSHEQRNCWGFGGSGPNRIWFNSYEEAIDLITDRLVNAYGPEYMVDPESMQYTYCGPTCHNWGATVQAARYEINRLAIQMGYSPMMRE